MMLSSVNSLSWLDFIYFSVWYCNFEVKLLKSDDALFLRLFKILSLFAWLTVNDFKELKHWSQTKISWLMCTVNKCTQVTQGTYKVRLTSYVPWLVPRLSPIDWDRQLSVYYKVRNEIETKRNQRKRKRNETKRNEAKSTKTKRNETKRNQQKRNETKRNQRNENKTNESKTKSTKTKRNRLIWRKWKEKNKRQNEIKKLKKR